MSLADWIARPGYATRNLFTGNPGGAYRQLQDFLIPWGEVDSDPETDYPTTGNFVTDTLTNPLVLLPGAKLAQAGSALGRSAALRKVREISGNELLPQFGRDVVEARQLATGAGNVMADEVQRMVAARPDEAFQRAIGEVAQNITGDKTTGYRPLGDSYPQWMPRDVRDAQITKNAQAHPLVQAGKIDGDELARATIEVADFGERQRRQLIQSGAWEDLTPEYFDAQGQNVDTGPLFDRYQYESSLAGKYADPEDMPTFEEWMGLQGMSKRNDIVAAPYLQRNILNPNEDWSPTLMTKDRQTEQDLLPLLNDPDSELTFDPHAGRAMANRITQQTNMLRRQKLGEAVTETGPDSTFTAGVGDAHNQFETAVKQHVRAGRIDDEEAKALLRAYTGLKPREGWAEFLNKYPNRLFRGAAVYGVMIPRLAGLVRNRISTGFMAMGSPTATAGQAVNQFKRLPSDVWDSIVVDGLGLRNLKTGQLTDALDEIQEAVELSGGMVDDAAGILRANGRPDLAAALEYDVMDGGFVAGEQLLKRATAGDTKRWWQKMLESPMRMFHGTEQRARLGLFLDKYQAAQKKSGGPVPQSSVARMADDTENTLYRYGHTSESNRMARDLFPFTQFAFQSVPREGMKLLRNPWAMVGVAHLLDSPPGEEVPGYVEGQMRVNLGETDEGKNRWLHGFGHPAESIAELPFVGGGGIGENMLGVAGRLAPILKAPAALAFNRDPFSGEEFGNYSYNPLTGDYDEFGRAYQTAASTGLIQPVATVLNTIGALNRDSNPLLSRVSQVTTGVRTTDVDPLRQAASIIEAELDRTPQARKFTQYYGADDPSIQGSIDRLNEVRNALADRAKAEAANVE